VEDFAFILEASNSKTNNQHAKQRINILLNKFYMHVTYNKDQEKQEIKKVTHRDFYTIRKVDTHIHHSASVTAKHLLDFIKLKLKTEKDTVINAEGKTLG
jgi:AMP deaminase